MNLIMDKKSGKTAGLSTNTGDIKLSHSITDTIADDRMISFVSLGAYYHSRYAVKWKIEDIQDENKIRIKGYEAYQHYFTTHYVGIQDGNMSSIPNLIIPGAPITLSLKVAGTLSEQENAFPKLTIFPGTRIKVIKKRMTPPSLSKEALAAEVLSAEAGYLVTSTYASRQNQYQPKEHGEFISVEANNSGFHHFFSKRTSSSSKPGISNTGKTLVVRNTDTTYVPNRTVGSLKMTRIMNW